MVDYINFWLAKYFVEALPLIIFIIGLVLYLTVSGLTQWYLHSQRRDDNSEDGK